MPNLKTTAGSVALIMMLSWIATVGVSAGEPGPQEPSALQTGVDLLVIRPLGWVGAVVSTVAFVVTLPISYPESGAYRLSEAYVQKPWDFINSNRALGDFQAKENPALSVDHFIEQRYAHYFSRESQAP